MSTSRAQMFGQQLIAGALLLVMCILGLMSQGCATHRDPQTFATPEEAVQTLATALRVNDMDRLKTIVGSAGRDILESGDEVADKNRREKFLSLYDEKHSLETNHPESRTLVVGATDWPFPVPIVNGPKGWYFDCEAGIEEILNRRIGENELAAIEVCQAIADAQREYALLDPDGNGVHEYAQKLLSDPGKRNGLYWPVAEGETPSPMGEWVAKAAGEGYRHKGDEGRTPYHGYYYLLLREQGPNAPNGALSYMVNGKMTLGFALVAWPADYDKTGIMTFIMAADGVVYQKDLGEDTETLAREMKVFDPGPGWVKAEVKPPATQPAAPTAQKS